MCRCLVIPFIEPEKSQRNIYDKAARFVVYKVMAESKRRGIEAKDLRWKRKVITMEF